MKRIIIMEDSRLGFVFDGNTSSSVIARLSEEENPQDKQTYNTEVNGKTLGKNEVLGYNNGSVFATSDPSAPVADYTISFDNDRVSLPGKALLSMEFNKIYTVDIYFYLEGCDPDCSESITLKQADLFLAFYGVISQ